MLEIKNLKTQYTTDDGDSVHAVDGVDLELDRNVTLGLVGESGCGKTTIAKTLTRLLPRNGEIVDGQILFEGRDLNELSNEAYRKQIRWNEIALIPQYSMNAFDPVYTVGKQIVQVIRYKENASKKEAWRRARELFERVGIDENRVTEYPHQFSGGMAQRAMIALAVALDPSIIVADEPTTALDVVIQDRILNMMKDIQDEINSSMILITHDMSVVSETCDKIAVMYGGRIMEYGDADTIIGNPVHPYSLGLRNAFPDITLDSQELVSIPGTPPTLIEPDEGCRFVARCPFAEEECREYTPQTESFEEGHRIECHRQDEASYLRERGNRPETWRAMREEVRESDGNVTQEADDD